MKHSLPPEVLFGDEMRAPVVDCLHDVVVGTSALHSPPEVVLLELVLVTEPEHARLQGNDFLGGKGLSDAVCELQLCGNALDVHQLYQLYKTIIFESHSNQPQIVSSYG